MLPPVTPLQKEAWSLMMAMPEWRLIKTVKWMKKPMKVTGLAQDLKSRHQALADLDTLAQSLSEIDFKKTLDEVRMERYSSSIT